jgi:hypothetical protein
VLSFFTFSFSQTQTTANERTFLAWMSMAVSLGGVSTALVGFTAEVDPKSEAVGRDRKRERGGEGPQHPSIHPSIPHSLSHKPNTKKKRPTSAGKKTGPLTPHTTALMTALLLPLAAAMAGYGLWIFVSRSQAFRARTVGFHQDWVGPAALAAALLGVLSTIMVAAFVKVVKYG